MKVFIKLFVCHIIFLSVIIYPQKDEIKLENIKAPSMPSASIIGIQVNEINKPKSLKALEEAIFSNYTNSDQSIIIPNNYALEFNPFMLSGRKNFSYSDYLENKPLLNIWRNLSLSVSSTTEFSINDSISSNAMGFGIRTIILNGEPNKDIGEVFKTALDMNEDELEIKTLVRTLISKYINDNPSNTITIDNIRSFVLQELEKNEINKPTDENGNVMTGEELTKHIILLTKAKTVVNSVFDEIDREISIENIEEEFEILYDKNISAASLEYLRKILERVKNYRYGLRWDLNLAYALAFPENNFKSSISPKWGLWTNVSYLSEGTEDLTFIGLARFTIYNDKYLNRYQPIDEIFKTGNIFDLGIRLIYEYEELSIEFEYVHRFNQTKMTKVIDRVEFYRDINKETSRYLINLNYNVLENIVISFNFGKDYENISREKNLISNLSINFGFCDIKAGDLLFTKK